MKRFVLIFILFLSLLGQKVHCEPNKVERGSSALNAREDQLTFKSSEAYNYLFGELPSAQVFFNIIPEASSSSLANNKIKESGFELFHSNARVNHKLSIHQDSVFGRYCSVFGQIYLKTACFRL